MSEHEDYPSAPRYSSFTPILILILSFLFVNVIQITETFRQKGELAKTQEQLDKVKEEIKPIVEKADVINKTIEGFLKDLVAIAPKSPGAQKIVQDFNIRLMDQAANNPAPANPPKTR